MGFTRRELRLGFAATLVGAAIAVVLVLSGRPAEEDESGIDESFNAEQAAVATVIETAGATRRADDCDRLATTRFLDQTFRLSGETALSACQGGLGDSGLLDEPLRVASVELGNEGDTAVVVYETGSDKAGVTATVSLRDGRLDRIEDYLESERGALERALRNELLRRPDPIDKEQIDCAIARLRSLSDAELESLLLTGSIAAIYRPVLACDRGPFVTFLVRELAGPLDFLPPSSLDCAGDRLAALPAAALVKILVDPEHTAAARIPFDCDRAAALAAYRASLLGPPQRYPTRIADCVVRGLGGLPPRAIAATLVERGTDQLLERCDKKP